MARTKRARRAWNGLAAALVLLTAPSSAFAQTGESDRTPNESGDALETEVAVILKNAGYVVLLHSAWRQSYIYDYPLNRWALFNAPYETIYGGATRIEFLLIDGEREILVEAKRQTSSGSVDEKFPFIYHNALLNIEEHGREFVFVMDGEGSREGARDWIAARAAATPGFTVLGPDALADWLSLPLCAGAEETVDATGAPSCTAAAQTAN